MNLENFYENVKRRRSRQLRNRQLLAWGLICLVVVIFLTAMNHERKQEVKLLKSHDSGLSIEQMKYQAYFHKAGAGIQSAEVAAAVMQSKRKKLTAAICMVESQGIKNAYNKKSKAKGMYQVMERHWGKVNTKSALAMTAQHDRIMDELLSECDGNLKKALNNYGGDTKRKVYANNILSELENFDK